MNHSIKDIANALNLSITTISWILSGQGEARGFSEARIKEVQDYAAKVNYRPNQLARSLQTGKTQTIGLIIPQIGDSFFAHLAQAVELEAEKHGYVLTICSSRGDGKREKHLIQTLREKQVDGLIIVPSEKTQSLFGQMLRDKTPFVFVDRHFPHLKTNYIVVDNAGGSYKLTESLIVKGCRRIAYINTESHLSVMELRLRGYANALRAYNIKYDENLYVEMTKNFFHNKTNEKIKMLLKNAPDLDGIVFSTHFLAIDVIRCLTQKRIPYKERFKIASFHSNAALEILVPKVAVARIKIDEIGRTAVDTLLQNIKNPEMDKQELISSICYERL
ncbi:MAG: LacI family transcriptional regulator [Tannerella sp.]|jgi:LacI family transcriptional regulator|nr:LacI family transcriptional regulator [Tannerella sp.]